jgi:hypothetical protein
VGAFSIESVLFYSAVGYSLLHFFGSMCFVVLDYSVV